MRTKKTDPCDAEARFAGVFVHLGSVTAYARRRGSPDPEGIAAEAMTIAWRRLADVPTDDARPWLYATARNLLLAEWRQRQPVAGDRSSEPEAWAPSERVVLDPAIAAALRTLSVSDREALLLVAWEDLSPKLAARTLGIGVGAFRVRLHRARRRFRDALAHSAQTDTRR